MDKEQIEFWWETFCNSCMCENCGSCDTPVGDNLMGLISLPSNYENIENR